MVIKFKRLSDKAIAPVKAHATDAGFDITCVGVSSELSECGQVILVYHTALAVEIPEGYFGALVPRSSISKKSIDLTNCMGVIDAGYRGEILGKFRVTTDVIPAVYKEGERFAQLIILPIPSITVVEAEELSETWMPHPAQPFLHIGHDFISASRQNVHGKPVSATCEHAVAWFKMDVISPMEGFLAMGGDVCAKMPLVG